MADEDDVVVVDGRRYAKRGVNRGHEASDDAYRVLQILADDGHIELLTIWCSEKGSMDTSGHFHGAGARHLPETFRILPAPGEGVELLMPEPYRFTMPIDREDTDAT